MQNKLKVLALARNVFTVAACQEHFYAANTRYKVCGRLAQLHLLGRYMRWIVGINRTLCLHEYDIFKMFS